MNSEVMETFGISKEERNDVVIFREVRDGVEITREMHEDGVEIIRYPGGKITFIDPSGITFIYMESCMNDFDEYDEYDKYDEYE